MPEKVSIPPKISKALLKIVRGQNIIDEAVQDLVKVMNTLEDEEASE